MPKPQMRTRPKHRTIDHWIEHYRTGFNSPELPSIKRFMEDYISDHEGQNNQIAELRLQAINYLLLEGTLK